MYPSRELKILEERRDYLQRRIALRREECLIASEGIRQGVERLSAWAHVFRAGGLVGTLGSSFFGRHGRREDADGTEPAGSGTSWGQKAVQWAPVALRAFRLFSSFV